MANSDEHLVGWECSCGKCWAVMNEMDYLRNPINFSQFRVARREQGKPEHACACPDRNHKYIGRILEEEK